MRHVSMLGALLLIGCGPQTAPTSRQDTDTASVEERPANEIAARISELPAPYDQGNYANGRKVFAQCRACHSVGAGEPNRVGPHLRGIFGRTAGAVPDFRTYSASLTESGIVWDAANLDKWSADPRNLVPATNMIFPGIGRAEDRRDLIAYLAVETTD